MESPSKLLWFTCAVRSHSGAENTTNLSKDTDDLKQKGTKEKELYHFLAVFFVLSFSTRGYFWESQNDSTVMMSSGKKHQQNWHENTSQKMCLFVVHFIRGPLGLWKDGSKKGFSLFSFPSLRRLRHVWCVRRGLHASLITASKADKSYDF